MLRSSPVFGLPLALTVVALVSGPTRAECFDYSTLFRPLGSTTLSSDATDVAVSGEYAFVTTGEGSTPSLQVFDVSAVHGGGGAIVPVAALPLPSGAYGIAVASDHAYLATSSGLLAIDISDPTQPVLLGTAGTSANDVTVHGDVALVTTNYGLDVFSLADPGAPVPVGHLALSGCHEICTEGAYAYLARDSGLGIANVSDPAHPALVATVALPVPMYGLAIGDGHAFVAGGVRWQIETRGDLYTIDVRQPSAPHIVGHLDLGWDAGVSASWNEGVAYVSQAGDILGGYTGELTLVDVTHPDAPTVMRRLDLDEQGRGTCVQEDRFFMTGGHDWTTESGALRVYSSVVLPGPILSDVPTPDMANAVDAQGDMAYVLDWTATLRILDVSSPQQPVERGTLPIAAGPMGVVARGNFAYLGFQTSGLQVVDIADPDRPHIVTTLSPIRYVWRLRARENKLYVLQNSTGLTILDLTTPSSPVLQGSVPVPGYDYDFALSGDCAFIASVTSFEVVNVSDPAAPYRVSSLAIPAWAIDVAGDFAIVLDDYGNVRVVDIADPAHPAQVAFLDNGSHAEAVVVDGDIAYLATTTGLAAVDISDPYAPFEIGEECTGSMNAKAVTCTSSIVLLADGEAGLVLLSKHCAAASVNTEPVASGLRLRVSPNPLVDHATVAFELPSSVTADVGVYDLAGRRIVPLSRRATAGSQVLTWDGRNARGVPVPSGVYWVRVRAAGRSSALRMVKLAP